MKIMIENAQGTTIFKYLRKFVCLGFNIMFSHRMSISQSLHAAYVWGKEVPSGHYLIKLSVIADI